MSEFPFQPEPVANGILLSLPAETLRCLNTALEFVRLTRGQALGHAGEPIQHIYFVNRGLISLVKTMQDGSAIEIEAVGPEGISSPNAVFGFRNAVLDSVVQVSGSAFRVRRGFLRELSDTDPTFRDAMQKYAELVIAQLSQTAACNRLHSLQGRCCRWLLTAHDSAAADTFDLTHDFLATMLGVQRPSVSIVARFLKDGSFIDYKRSQVTITDRQGLEEYACECYRAVQSERERLFPKTHRERGLQPAT
jgi:CRP-like cAMP-binding protein